MNQETETAAAVVPPKIEVKSIKHQFSPQEVAQLNVDFRGAFGTLKTVLAEFDAVKASYKAKTTEAESRMETLNATLQAGFEIRPTRCVVVFRAKDRKKDYFLEAVPAEDLAHSSTLVPVLIEDMTPRDFEIDLLQAEAKFGNREEIEIFPAKDGDSGKIVVGSFEGSWFCAVRISIGKEKIDEKFDTEQRAFKKRPQAIDQATKRAYGWLKATLGRDAAKGFEDSLAKIVEAHKEREE